MIAEVMIGCVIVVAVILWMVYCHLAVVDPPCEVDLGKKKQDIKNTEYSYSKVIETAREVIAYNHPAKDKI